MDTKTQEIKLEIPENTIAMSITLLTDNGSYFDFICNTFSTESLKNGHIEVKKKIN